MVKNELMKRLSEVSKLSQKDCEKVMKAFEEVTIDALQEEESINMMGFLTIETKEVAEREVLKNVRQPELGKKTVPAHKGVRVKIGARLKDSVK